MFPRRYRNVSPVCTTSGRAHSVRVRDDQNLGIILNRRRRDEVVAKARRTSFDHEQHPRQSVMRAGELECFEIGSGSLDSASGPTWHTTDVAEPLDVNESDAFRDLSDPERAMARHSESLWRRAHQIARDNAGVDPGDIYQALRCLELEPAERLRRGRPNGDSRCRRCHPPGAAAGSDHGKQACDEASEGSGQLPALEATLLAREQNKK